MLEYNKSINDFITKNSIDVEALENCKEAIIYNKKDINYIVSSYGMYKNPEKSIVSIDNIIGKYRSKTQNILLELNSLFFEDGNSYQKRSISMLKYNSSNILDGLEQSFVDDPILLKEIKKEKYIIGNNGMHRCNLLRLHYLIELKKCTYKQKLNKLKEKYKIPVQIEKLDFIKTYAKFMLHFSDRYIIMEDEVDDKMQKTERVIIVDDQNNIVKLNNDELIDLLNINLPKIIENDSNKEILKLYKEDYEFAKFVDENMNVTLMKGE